MLVPVDIYMEDVNSSSTSDCCFVYFVDGGGCSVLRSDVLTNGEGQLYLDLTRSKRDYRGDWVYNIQTSSGSITLIEEQEKLYGLL